jgi:hypothetical protein
MWCQRCLRDITQPSKSITIGESIPDACASSSNSGVENYVYSCVLHMNANRSQTPGCRYAKAYAKLAATGFQLHWQSIPAKEQARGKKSSKTKFTCPKCGLNAWAKPDACLICGECYDDGQGHICLMVAVSWGATGEPAHAGTVACRSASCD